ncbi:peptidase M15 [Pseudodesulfovibrio sp. F-1]|uniref:D-alanyl-D-alanine dipeptidase n=2 Tax=Pseudodesulfovibrio alkaliphilus TaxID=2661613 RepID=A0A7K1KK57_9BACT|nr:peptidase M15 [Pseudodesulfovibrio alkaliphilus]
MRFFLPSLLLLLLLAAPAWAAGLPEGFCHVEEVVPGVVLDVRYFTSHNFLGDPVDGYEAPRVILTVQAARALAGVQATLARFGLGLKVFDGYRPQRAVDHFVRWAEDLSDTRMKAEFYPDVDKAHLFRDGYIAARSGHSRGSTVDLTIIDLGTGEALDMGTPFDFFGPPSWPESPAMSAQVRANRALLQGIMVSHGFRPLAEEWWHFTLENEPFPDTWFDFPVR